MNECRTQTHDLQYRCTDDGRIILLSLVLLYHYNIGPSFIRLYGYIWVLSFYPLLLFLIDFKVAGSQNTVHYVICFHLESAKLVAALAHLHCAVT